MRFDIDILIVFADEDNAQTEKSGEGWVSQFRKFLEFIHPVRAEEITQTEIHRYLLYLVDERRVSISTQNQSINSIKFYLEKVKKGPRQEYYLDRPRKEEKLPVRNMPVCWYAVAC